MYTARKTEEEVEEACLRRALTNSLNTGLIPATDARAMAKGGSSGTFAKDFFRSSGTGKSYSPRTPPLNAKCKHHNLARPHTRREQAPVHNTRARHASPVVGSTEQQQHVALSDTTGQDTLRACQLQQRCS